jgi:hypothetical protein
LLCGNDGQNATFTPPPPVMVRLLSFGQMAYQPAA